MFKTTIAAAAAAVAFAPAAALAGPYVNVEANASWTGDDYTSTTTDVHVGYEGEVGTASYYVQAGPAIVAVVNWVSSITSDILHITFFGLTNVGPFFVPECTLQS